MGTSRFCTGVATTGMARFAACACWRCAPSFFCEVLRWMRNATAATARTPAIKRMTLRSRIRFLLPASHRAQQLCARRGEPIVRLYGLRRGLGERHLRVPQLDGAAPPPFVSLRGELQPHPGVGERLLRGRDGGLGRADREPRRVDVAADLLPLQIDR